jgi:copper homeostasis protein
MQIKLEICAADINSAIAANEGGAERIELCSALEIGGLTPSSGLINQAINSCNIPLHVLIRPRSGNFSYNLHEEAVILNDVQKISKTSCA